MSDANRDLGATQRLIEAGAIEQLQAETYIQVWERLDPVFGAKLRAVYPALLDEWLAEKAEEKRRLLSPNTK